jgi:CO/xanthine dehydrogenase FAD-binding subunit
VSVDLVDPGESALAGPACRFVRVVLGGVGPLPFVVDTAGLAGQPATAGTWRAAGELAAAQIDPPADGHGSAAYRKKLAATMVQRALAEATGTEGTGTEAAGTEPAGSP